MAGTVANSHVSESKSMRVLGSYAIVYLLKGSGFYRDGNGFRAELLAGSLLMLFPEVAHLYGPRRGEHWGEIYVVFDGPIFDLWRERGLLDSSRPVAHLEPIEEWHRRLTSTLLPSRPRGVGEAAIEVCAFAHLLTQMLAPRLDAQASPCQSDWVSHACYLLCANLEKPLELQSVAGECGLSYESFRKRFASEVGVSPARYRAERRIGAACALLDHPGMAIKSVASGLGFSDEFHFAKRFKQITGKTPNAYRQRKRAP